MQIGHDLYGESLQIISFIIIIENGFYTGYHAAPFFYVVLVKYNIAKFYMSFTTRQAKFVRWSHSQVATLVD